MITDSKLQDSPIGLFPEDWDVITLTDCNQVEVIMGQSPPGHSYNTQEMGIPFFQGNADFGNLYPIIKIYTTSPLKKSLKDDILVSVRAPVGEFNLSPCDCSIGRGLAAIRITSSVLDLKYLYFHLNHQSFRLSKVEEGTTFKAIKKADLQEFLIARPPISEQRRIAEILDIVDQTTTQTEQLIEKLRAIKSGLQHDLLTRGIGDDGRVRDPEKHPEKFKDSVVGLVPKGWNVESLGNLGDVVGGTTPSTSIPEYWNGTIPFVIPTDITNHEDSDYLTTTERYITKRGLNSISSNLLTVGSILITSRATIGYATISQVPLVTNQGILSVVCGNNLHNEYLIYRVRYNKQQLERLSCGTTFLEVGRNAMRNLQIPAPPIAEQKEIARLLTSSQASIDSEKEMLEKLKMIKSGLMHDLLTGRVRVKVPKG